MTLKLLIHAPTAQALGRARRNLVNLLAAQPAAHVELVVNGAAVAAALAQPDAETDQYLLLCENSLRKAGLALPPGHRTVGAAIAHIAIRQVEGWSYFRA